jgi:hypothetical protein
MDARVRCLLVNLLTDCNNTPIGTLAGFWPIGARGAQAATKWDYLSRGEIDMNFAEILRPALMCYSTRLAPMLADGYNLTTKRMQIHMRLLHAHARSYVDLRLN